MYLKDSTVKKRYSIFPVIHNDLWQMYKKAEAQTWVAEEIDLSKYYIATFEMASSANLKDGAWNLAIGQSVGNPNVRN